MFISSETKAAEDSGNLKVFLTGERSAGRSYRQGGDRISSKQGDLFIASPQCCTLEVRVAATHRSRASRPGCFVTALHLTAGRCVPKDGSCFLNHERHQNLRKPVGQQLGSCFHIWEWRCGFPLSEKTQMIAPNRQVHPPPWLISKQ